VMDCRVKPGNDGALGRRRNEVSFKQNK